MSDPSLETYIEPELEARIVAMVLGEASQFEEEELERLIAERPEVALFRDRMAALHGMLREIGREEKVGGGETGGETSGGEEWRLSDDRRRALREVFGASVSGEKKKAQESGPAKVVRLNWLRIGVAVAATVVLLAGLMFPASMGVRPSSTDAEVAVAMNESKPGGEGFFSVDSGWGFVEREDFDFESLEKRRRAGSERNSRVGDRESAGPTDFGTTLFEEPGRNKSLEDVNSSGPVKLFAGREMDLKRRDLLSAGEVATEEDAPVSGPAVAQELERAPDRGRVDVEFRSVSPDDVGRDRRYGMIGHGGMRVEAEKEGRPGLSGQDHQEVQGITGSGNQSDISTFYDRRDASVLPRETMPDAGLGIEADKKRELSERSAIAGTFVAPVDELERLRDARQKMPRIESGPERGDDATPEGRLSYGFERKESADEALAEIDRTQALSGQRMDGAKTGRAAGDSVDLDAGEETSREESATGALDSIRDSLKGIRTRIEEAPSSRTQPAVVNGRTSEIPPAPAPVAPVGGRGAAREFRQRMPEEKKAAEQPFSTFSLHVSDVSFKLALAALNRGEWPEAERIRIEEFVNAFDYGDPVPAQEEKVAAAIEQAVHPTMQQRSLLRISMRTAAAGRRANTPLNLTFLIDASGSMERFDRQETLLRAFSLLAAQLKENDRVTLISFAREPRLVAEALPGDRGEELVALVSRLPEEGGTNLESALGLAFEKAKAIHAEGSQSRIILLTDGAANLGDADPERLAGIVEQMRGEGIAFDAAGIGADGLNDEILEALTRKGDGRYYLLDRPEDADDQFARQIAGALRPAAKNVKVQVEFNPLRVGRYQLHGFEKHRLKKEDFRDDRVDAAEMSAEEAGVALYQFETLPEGQGEIGSVSVRFRDMETGRMIEKRWPIPYQPTLPRLDEASDSIRIAAVATLVASKLKREPLGELSEWGDLRALIGELPPKTRERERVDQLGEIIDRAMALEGNPREQ